MLLQWYAFQKRFLSSLASVLTLSSMGILSLYLFWDHGKISHMIPILQATLKYSDIALYMSMLDRNVFTLFKNMGKGINCTETQDTLGRASCTNDSSERC